MAPGLRIRGNDDGRDRFSQLNGEARSRSFSAPNGNGGAAQTISCAA